MRLTRRRAVAGLGTLTAGVGWLATQTPTVRAATDIEGEYTVETDDGRINYVAIWGDTRMEWSGFERTARWYELDWTLTIAEGSQAIYQKPLHTGQPTDLNQNDYGGAHDRLSGHGKRGYVERGFGLTDDGARDPATDWHIIAADGHESHDSLHAAPAKYVRVDEEGATRTFLITLQQHWRWYDGDPSKDGQQIHNATVYIQPTLEITNLAPTTTSEDEDAADGLAVNA